MFCIECAQEEGQVFFVHVVCVGRCGEVKEKEKKTPNPAILDIIISCLT